MKHPLLLERALLSFSLTVSALIGGQVSAGAQVSDATLSSEFSQKRSPTTSQTTEVLANPDNSTPSLEESSSQAPVDGLETVAQEPQPEAARMGSPVPKPGTVSTSTSGFFAQSPDAPPPAETPAPSAPVETSTVLETRYRFSYAGFGVNLGTGSGDTALGEVSFAAFSKFAFSPYFSFRPAALVSNDVSFLFPFTYDFPNQGPGTISPYVGVGPIFSTGKSDNVDLLLTAGLDYPLNPQIAVTASVNIAPLNKFDIGFILGLAYTFATETITTTAPSLGQIIPQKPPRPNPSYLGGGVNFGAGGRSGLGRVSGAVYSKIALGSTFSFRPAVLISRDVSFLLPVTYDFDVISLSDYIRLAPYAGAGAIFSTGKDNTSGLLLTGGVDIPLSNQFAATVGVNIAPIDRFSIGFLVGVAYTFGPFDR
ncbi:hypothetical protein [Leptothermofonsia sp. ETS-13]|uniref:hypothetical protein n=1 Tax=Leptothermofonsia sp. ETS-13 TaxID=3035696 RepID=UPI003B9DE236